MWPSLAREPLARHDRSQDTVSPWHPSPQAAEQQGLCRSCLAPLAGEDRERAAEADGRCFKCRQLYKEDQFCPVCERVWQVSVRGLAMDERGAVMCCAMMCCCAT